MESKANRTLLKSAPELWKLADEECRMQAWMAALVGPAEAIGVEVTEREPERFLAWRAANGERPGRIALELAEKGFGTSVAITAQHEGSESKATDALENLLDELGSPERQPFARG